MPWISVDLDVRDHPKTRHLSKLLQCSRHEAIGILVVLWQWGLTNATREGVISYASDEDIAMGIMITNKSPQQLVGALVESGWIDKSESGEYTLHDWSEWQSMWYQAVDRRKSNAEVQKRIRMRKSDALKNIGVESLPIDSHDDSHDDSHRDCHGDTCADNVKNAMDSGKTIPIVENINPFVAEAESNNKKKRLRTSIDCQPIIDLFHSLCPSLPKIQKVTDARKRAISSFLKQYSMDEARILFEKAEKSSFLKYGGAQNWRATFDWLIKDSNAAKVMDGNYDDQKCGLGVNKTERAPDYSDTSRYTNIGME